jgi:hypothetical protein
MPHVAVSAERRKHKRVSVDFPVTYRLQGTSFLGKAVNASNEGMMVESYLGPEAALRILQSLAYETGNNAELKFTYKNKAYRAEGEMKHCHLEFFGREPFRAQLGLFLPKIE